MKSAELNTDILVDRVTVHNLLSTFLMGPSSWERYKEAISESAPSRGINDYKILNEENVKGKYREFPFVLYIKLSSKRFEDDQPDTDYRYATFVLLAPRDIVNLGLHGFIIGELKSLQIQWKDISLEGSY